MYYYQNKILIAAVIRLKFENIEIKIKNNINAYWKECKKYKIHFCFELHKNILDC